MGARGSGERWTRLSKAEARRWHVLGGCSRGAPHSTECSVGQHAAKDPTGRARRHASTKGGRPLGGHAEVKGDGRCWSTSFLRRSPRPLREVLVDLAGSRGGALRRLETVEAEVARVDLGWRATGTGLRRLGEVGVGDEREQPGGEGG